MVIVRALGARSPVEEECKVIEGEQVEVDLPLFDVGLDASNDGQFRFSFSLFFFASLLFLAHGRSCPDEVSSISSL